MKGIRGVFAAVLVLESIVVLLALLVFARFGNGAARGGRGGDRRAGGADDRRVGLQRRPWGLGYALVLQLVTIVAGFVLVIAAGRGRGDLRARRGPGCC